MKVHQVVGGDNNRRLRLPRQKVSDSETWHYIKRSLVSIQRIYIYKRPGRASQNSSLIISQCINSILVRTDLDLFLFLLFFFPFDFVGFIFCMFSSAACEGVLLSSLWWVNSLVMGSDEVEVSGSALMSLEGMILVPFSPSSSSTLIENDKFLFLKEFYKLPTCSRNKTLPFRNLASNLL